MNRRVFLKAGTAGLAMATGSWTLPGQACAQDKAASPVSIDPDALAKAAVKHFIPGGKTCGEAILAAGCDALGIKSDLVPDIALGLAGGIGLQGKTCGIVSGAAMVLGIALGRKQRDYPKKTGRVFKAAGDFCKSFEAKLGSTQCRKLSGLDLTTPEGRKALKEGVKANRCRRLVEQGAKMLARSLSEA